MAPPGATSVHVCVEFCVPVKDGPNEPLHRVNELPLLSSPPHTHTHPMEGSADTSWLIFITTVCRFSAELDEHVVFCHDAAAPYQHLHSTAGCTPRDR